MFFTANKKRLATILFFSAFVSFSAAAAPAYAGISIKKPLGGGSSVIRGGSSSSGNAIQGAVSNTANAVKEAAKDTANAVTEAVKDTANVAKEATNDAIRTTKEAVNDTLTNVVNPVINIVEIPIILTVDLAKTGIDVLTFNWPPKDPFQRSVCRAGNLTSDPFNAPDCSNNRGGGTGSLADGGFDIKGNPDSFCIGPDCAAVCGNGVCEAWETSLNCNRDCGTGGNSGSNPDIIIPPDVRVCSGSECGSAGGGGGSAGSGGGSGNGGGGGGNGSAVVSPSQSQCTSVVLGGINSQGHNYAIIRDGEIVKQLAASETAFTDSGLAPHKKYSYKLRIPSPAEAGWTTTDFDIGEAYTKCLPECHFGIKEKSIAKFSDAKFSWQCKYTAPVVDGGSCKVVNLSTGAEKGVASGDGSLVVPADKPATYVLSCSNIDGSVNLPQSFATFEPQVKEVRP